MIDWKRTRLVFVGRLDENMFVTFCELVKKKKKVCCLCKMNETDVHIYIGLKIIIWIFNVFL